MKISEAMTKFEDKYFGYAEIRKNPGDMNEYISLLLGWDGKSFMLCDDNDAVISSNEVAHMILMLKQVGFRKAKVYF